MALVAPGMSGWRLRGKANQPEKNCTGKTGGGRPYRHVASIRLPFDLSFENSVTRLRRFD
jgi:hypothetical protein